MKVSYSGSIRYALALLAMIASTASLAAQSQVLLSVGTEDTFKITEKYNLSKYVDGKYIGHVYREIRAVIGAKRLSGGALRFDGTFYVGEETTHDSALLQKKLDEAVPAIFTVSPQGRMSFERDSGYPDVRDFPAWPSVPVSVGNTWEGTGTRIVDPRDSGVKTRVPILSTFEFKGESVYKGMPVYTIKSKYATRYKRGQDRNGDPDLDRLEGTHDVTIVINRDTLAPILMTELMDEQYRFVSGGDIRLKGSVLTFWSEIVPVKASETAALIKDSLMGSGVPVVVAVPDDTSLAEGQGRPEPQAVTDNPPGTSPTTPPGPVLEGTIPGLTDMGIGVKERNDGVALEIRDIHFVADSDEILGEEKKRLDALAKALSAIGGNRSFLVEGHTADIGTKESQYTLSEKRAIKIIGEMTKRGIPASKFLFKGYGGDRPVAPNDIEKNRAMNRRVEILIME